MALQGGGGAHRRYVFRGKRGHIRSMWGENPFTIHEIYAALTQSDSRSDWASESDAAKQAENYDIKS